jgi:hypothetical protein
LGSSYLSNHSRLSSFVTCSNFLQKTVVSVSQKRQNRFRSDFYNCHPSANLFIFVLVQCDEKWLQLQYLILQLLQSSLNIIRGSAFLVFKTSLSKTSYRSRLSCSFRLLSTFCNVVNQHYTSCIQAFLKCRIG